MISKRDFLKMQIKFLIDEHINGMRDRESMLEAYMRDIKDLDFEEMLSYREYLKVSIEKYNESMEDINRYLYGD